MSNPFCLSCDGGGHKLTRSGVDVIERMSEADLTYLATEVDAYRRRLYRVGRIVEVPVGHDSFEWNGDYYTLSAVVRVEVIEGERASRDTPATDTEYRFESLQITHCEPMARFEIVDALTEFYRVGADKRLPCSDPRAIAWERVIEQIKK